MGSIVSIVYSPETSENARPEDRFERASIDTAQLLVGKGIAGDRKGGKYEARQLNLMAIETKQQLSADGFRIAPGELGEQITVQGIDVDRLKPGARLRLGET